MNSIWWNLVLHMHVGVIYPAYFNLESLPQFREYGIIVVLLKEPSSSFCN
jgi:hypothetical protein